jgi:dihydroorotate dehydrogenase
VTATLAPCEAVGALRDLAARLVGASSVPVVVKLPERPALGYGRIGETLAAAGVGAVVVKNEFAGLEKFLLETHAAVETIAAGGVRSGYDVRRAIAKGAKAVQIRSALVAEGPDVFARLEREMRLARGGR